MHSATVLRAGRAPKCPQHPCAGKNHRNAGNFRDPMPCGSDLLSKNENGQSGDPNEIHDSAGKEEAHEEPAATQTIKAMVPAEPKGTARAWTEVS